MHDKTRSVDCFPLERVEKPKEIFSPNGLNVA
jgi:hypothetical protein